MVRVHDPARVGFAGAIGERDVVHDVTAERRKRATLHRFVRGRSRLRVLTCDTPDLHDGHASRVGQRHRHLQNDAQLFADAVGARVERLGAVSCLEKERLASSDLGQLRSQRTSLAGKNEWWPFGQGLDDPVELGIVGPRGLLHGRVVAPDRRGPSGWGYSGVTHGERIPVRWWFGKAISAQDAARPCPRDARTASTMLPGRDQAASILAAAA